MNTSNAIASRFFVGGVFLSYLGSRTSGSSIVLNRAGSKEVIEKLNNYLFAIKMGKKTLKWTKQGMNQLITAIQSGAFTESLKTWAVSKKALKIYILIIGSVAMSTRNRKIKDSLAWSLLTESKKITDAQELITRFTKFVQSPKDQLLPMAFAFAMIASQYGR